MTIAGALERKVWAKVFKRILYPNLYVLLTGGPGIGKTDALRGTLDFWEKLPELHVAPSSVSRASLVDSLALAERSVLRPTEAQPFTKFNSLQIGATEFGTFLSAYDTEFLSTLNDLYDCVRYKESKRHMKAPIEMPSPQLNLIAGTTPAWLGGTLPETAWAEGFSSRLLLIYSGERIKIDPFGEGSRDEELEAKLLKDLMEIHGMFGQLAFEPEVITTFTAWYMADCPPVPDHPKLEHYLPRRHIHLLKLAMVMSVARASDYVIRMIDYQRAMDMLLEAEQTMPDVFKAMRYNSDANVYDETYAYVYNAFIKENKAIPEHRIIYFIGQRAPGHAVTKILEVMVSGGMLKIVDISGPGGRPTYKPASKSELGR
jgi:hypothetical protein